MPYYRAFKTWETLVFIFKVPPKLLRIRKQIGILLLLRFFCNLMCEISFKKSKWRIQITCKTINFKIY